MYVLRIARWPRPFAQVAGPLLVARLAALPGCASEQSDCSEGSEACRCTQEYQCLEGLVCLSDRCVDPDVFDPDTNAGTDDADTNADGESGNGSGADNVGACNGFADSLECDFPGGVDILMCEIYEGTTCDVSDYFDCLAENTTCMSGTLDASGWAECAELAECA